MNKIELSNFIISNQDPLVLIVGPCVIENRDHTLKVAESIHKICDKTNIKFVFKSSFDKANRTNIKSVRGVGIEESIRIFEEVKNNFQCPIITDVHNEHQCEKIQKNDVIDIIQIPAFLSRQTDLLLAAGKTKKIVNVKKGQFLSPYEVPNIIEKIESTNNHKIMITERGTSFGYNNLISDFRAIEIMKKFKYPVIFDATHSVQEPGGQGQSSGGKREFVPILSTAAVSLGVAALFIETHDDPDNAPSDGPNMLKIEDLANLIIRLKKYDELAKS